MCRSLLVYCRPIRYQAFPSTRLALALVLTAFAAIGLSQTGTTGSLSGTVLDDNGKPVAATVQASKLGSPAAKAGGQSSANGSFTLSNLPAGKYMVCVQAAGYLDPCAWSPVPPSVQINAGQTTTGFSMVARRGTTVNVRISDDDHILGALPVFGAVAGQSSTVPHVLVGVLTRHNTFEPALVTGTDTNGSDHQATIPPGESAVIHITGHAVTMTDNLGTVLNVSGASFTVNQAAADPPGLITVHVHR
jgi:hypothetical protein